MAKSRKQQRAAEETVAETARAVKDKVVIAAKATTEVAEKQVVEPALSIAKKRPPKKRHVRPTRQTNTAKPAPIARGTSTAARMMSAGVFKGMLAPTTTGSASETTRNTRSQNSAHGSSGSESSSSRATRRLARRRTSDS
jgi:hypothetical protein